MASFNNEPVSDAEAASLLDDLSSCPALVLAVSGGPDSTALMWLAARWRASRKAGPKLIAVTVDHGLRKDAAGEARAVAKLARKLGIAHRTLRWTGRKPKTGLPQAARMARYGLLADAARKAGAPAILTAHTRDDQAETVLIRMSRGCGLTGLAGMKRVAVIPGRPEGPDPESRAALTVPVAPGFRARSLRERPGMTVLIRPFLDIPKSRLVATLEAANVPFADDPTNRDPRFTRARLRGLLPRLAEEGLDPPRLATLARRLARAEAALAKAAAEAFDRLATEKSGRIALARAGFAALSPEIALRLLGRAIGDAGDEGPVELGKLEALAEALGPALVDPKARFRRSLAGAVVALTSDAITVERAPPRRSRALTKGRTRPQRGGKRR